MANPKYYGVVKVLPWRWIFAALLIFFSIVSFSQNPETGQDLEALKVAYRAAIKDAGIAEPDEISRDLEAIVDYNDRLVWRKAGSGRQLLVVSWASWDGYVKGPFNTGKFNIWVTVAHRVRDFCKKTAGNYALRLEQRLGLPPGAGKKYFVEIWVSPRDLFRPSADPDITDHEAEIDFPYWVDEAHKAWFNDLKSKSYAPDGYPWTRLGYTYDWGGKESEIGESEFVIKKNAAVEINAVYTNEKYCR